MSSRTPLHPDYRLRDIVKVIGRYSKFEEIIERGEKAGFSPQQALQKYIQHNRLDERIKEAKALREKQEEEKEQARRRWIEQNCASEDTWRGVGEVSK